MPLKTRKLFLGLFRIIISVLLISLIAHEVGVARTISRIGTLSPYSIIGAIGLLIFVSLLQARRWQLVLFSLGYSWKYWVVFREIWIGNFFNQLLPTSVGGDGVKAWRLYRAGISRGKSLRSVLVDRFFGLLACILLSVIAVPILFLMAPANTVTWVVALTVVLGLVGVLFLMRPVSILLQFFPAILRSEIYKLSEGINNNQHFSHLMLISLLIQIAIAGCVVQLCWGLGISANPLLVAALFQPTTLVTILPISFAGWGLREGALVAILSTIGVSSLDALPLSLAYGAILLISSLIGWFFFMTSKMIAPREIWSEGLATPADNVPSIAES